MPKDSPFRRLLNKAKLSPHIPSAPQPSPHIPKLRANFEGREAIYIEKGALLVRVTEIERLSSSTWAGARMLEIPSPGLGVGIFDRRQRKSAKPAQWTIGTSYLSSFTDDQWSMGYGGWSLYFNPEIVRGALELAAQLPETLDTFERYNQIVRFVQREHYRIPEDGMKVVPDS
jgi:hypothetical protein